MRARESHLLAETISRNPTLTPELVETSEKAFSAFINSKLVKCLPSPVNGTSPSATAFDLFQAILAKDQSDPIFAKEAREKEEKFGMYLTMMTKSAAAIRLAERRLSEGSAAGDAVKDLVDGASGVLGPYLGETVSRRCGKEISD